MQLELTTPRQAVDNGFLQETIEKSDFERFRQRMLKLLDHTNDAVDESESEEHIKNLIQPFLRNTNFGDDYFIYPKERQDLAIHNGKNRKSPVGVIIEAKRPANKAEMISKDCLNRKAFHEAILYYLRERIEQQNEDIKHIIITDAYRWFIFDAHDFERHFYDSKKLRAWYREWKQKQKVSAKTKFIYDHLESFVSELDANIKASYVDLKDYRKLLEKEELNRDEQKKLVPLFKLFTPTHLLKRPFSSDSNNLNKGFYRELLYIMGLREYKKKGTHYITRQDEENRQPASLIENTITQLKSINVLSRLENAGEYGETEEEQLFNVALQLLITWINRILFLKLLEAQLYKYHQEDEKFRFLNHREVEQYDWLNKLFFQVLAVPLEERSERITKIFGHIPYLNSSLFDVADIEHATLRISELEDGLQMPVYNQSKIRNRSGEKLKGESLSTLEYLLRFLDAYNFNAEGTAEIQEEAKSLINASVLGRIFEKINGYKDGSFFTPGYITEYMCRETIRKAAVQKFNNAFDDWNCESIEEVSQKIARHDVPYEEANHIVNSITICDPAVGSGHFLVSALNELIAIKSDLRIFVDDDHHLIRDVSITVEKDELNVAAGQEPFFEYRVKHEWKPNGKIERKVGHDTQRLQKALFREKNIIIENCLFGVDINPNSVNICRLRLWIELLKNAYYKEETGYQALEVLPNIDINIKQGNSLVSRFDLDADLSRILKNNDELTIEDYKEAVRNYKTTGNRGYKRQLKEQIESIKESFEVGLKELHPVRQKLKTQRAKLIKEEAKLDLFEGDKRSKKQQKEITNAEKKIAKLEVELHELESAAFYDQAFEWRFEFPEVLDDEGEFIGFDVVIGNPPYGVTLNEEMIKYYRSNFDSILGHAEIYYLFIELVLKGLLDKKGILSFIIPNAWLSNKYAKGIRELLLSSYSLSEIINFNQKQIFSDARVEASIIIVSNGKPNNFLKVGHEYNEKYLFNQKKWLKDDNLIINFSENRVIQNILEKINSSSKTLSDVLDISNGCKPYQTGYGKNYKGKKLTKLDVKNRIYHSAKKLDESYYKELKGKHVEKFYTKPSNQFIKWGPWLMSPKEGKYYFQPKILVRQIISNTFIATIDKTNAIADQTLYVAVPFDKNDIDHLEFFVGLINSKLYGFFFRKYYSEEDELFPKIKVNELKRLPFKTPSKKIEAEVSELAFKILTAKQDNPDADTSKPEAEIDRLVYELYGLSEKEIEVVEGKLNQSLKIN